MTTNNQFLHLKVGIGLSVKPMEAGPIREKATRFYWGIFQLLNKDTSPLPHDHESRVLRLSFEDDYEEESLEDDDYLEDGLEDDDFPAGGNALREEEDPLEEREELKDELFYK